MVLPFSVAGNKHTAQQMYMVSLCTESEFRLGLIDLGHLLPLPPPCKFLPSIGRGWRLRKFKASLGHIVSYCFAF